MRFTGGDRGVVSMAVVAPVVAALLGGGAAVVVALQVVSLAPSASETSQQNGTLSGQEQDLEYGNSSR